MSYGPAYGLLVFDVHCVPPMIIKLQEVRQAEVAQVPSSDIARAAGSGRAAASVESVKTAVLNNLTESILFLVMVGVPKQQQVRTWRKLKHLGTSLLYMLVIWSGPETHEKKGSLYMVGN